MKIRIVCSEDLEIIFHKTPSVAPRKNGLNLFRSQSAEYLLEEIDAGHSFLRLQTEQPRAPQNPHAVYSNDVAIDDVAPKLGLRLAF